MPTFIDPISKLSIGDSTLIPRLLTKPPSQIEIVRATENLILSASGWRKVFVASQDQEDASELVGPVDLVLAWYMAQTFAKALPSLTGKNQHNSTVLVAMDSRPTGTLLADVMIRALVGLGVKVQYIFIASTPEAMAHAKLDEQVDGLVYISASHNPVGHNGVKFGLKSGGVLKASQVNPLIESYKYALSFETAGSLAFEAIHAIKSTELDAIFALANKNKQAALENYTTLSATIVSNSWDEKLSQERMTKIALASRNVDLGIVADMNGSARCLSIDKQFFENNGLRFLTVNGTARQIAHRIVPEGQSLDVCRQELEKIWKNKAGFSLGYMPDNDGDRGNIVYIDQKKAGALILEAQEVFALSCLAELAYLVYCGDISYSVAMQPSTKLAIAVNDATSMRIEELAKVFGAEVWRAEVGEANVVQLAQKLRDQGYIVRILGEGSNGGNITHPSSVRDPLDTVMSLVKLLVLRDEGKHKGLFGIWCSLQNRTYSETYTLSDIIASLPQWTTTSAYEDCAIMKIAADHAQLKAAYEKIFQKEWQKEQAMLRNKFGIVDYQVVNYEGINTIIGMGASKRTGKERGGFKVLFADQNGDELGFLWMRGSGTEPVFRILVDLKGNNPEGETFLLDWHRAMIEQAEALSSTIVS